MKAKLNINSNGSFNVEGVDNISYLYFPLTNFHSLKSAITPQLGGDAKIDQNRFLLHPASAEDLHNSFTNRNMYFKVNDDFVWSITGNTPYQMLHQDNVELFGDFLTHKISRSHNLFRCDITSLVPMNDQYQELHKITLTNTSNVNLKLKPVVSVPIFSRSADNLRDHRHVTSLLNKATITKNGLINQPTFSFDERGHLLNKTHYGVFTHSNESLTIKNYIPILEEFIGEGRTLLNPIVAEEDVDFTYQVNDEISGYELTGAFEYEETVLAPNTSLTFIISLGIDDNINQLKEANNAMTVIKFDALLNQTKAAWHNELSTLQFHFKDDSYNGWLKWVTLQPILRRIYGCSFLPHHDYGRGGRGWRDLWQDLLALILMNPREVRESLLNNFLGVRIDGSNATIIGNNPGEFLADRNNIARVWMDHGSWPFLTTLLYVDKSGDYDILFAKKAYFYDKFTHYTKKVLKTVSSNQTLTKENTVYTGTVLEHLILQNLVPFYNVGKHNNLRLEDADWNDALDMAHGHGESVAFTALYGDNLVQLGNLLIKLNNKDIKKIHLLKEIKVLLTDFNYDDLGKRKAILEDYFNCVETSVSGQIETYDSAVLAQKLIDRGKYLLQQVRENEWLEGKENSWFNGYYDNDSKRLEDVENKKMTLTGQVFALFSNAASDYQVEEVIKSADTYLYNEQIGGYKLNTDFKEMKTNMGRLFGFSYGHKENGAMFSHMAVMYANALYKRGKVEAGHKVLSSIYNHCSDISKSKIYPGIPEYIDPKGRGMYHYLTGSASWYILTIVTEVFGVKGDLGNLVLEPKLLKEQFNNKGKASITTQHHNQEITVTYLNEKQLEYGAYQVLDVMSNEQQISFENTVFGVVLKDIKEYKSITVVLG